MVDRGLDPQTAMDEPRSFAFAGALQIEPGVPGDVRAELERRGHKLDVATSPIGGSQAICIDPETGVRMGGSDTRKDGSALGF
jgi:gamma-glutamyltranspeptidase/glutathione hydrolase